VRCRKASRSRRKIDRRIMLQKRGAPSAPLFTGHDSSKEHRVVVIRNLISLTNTIASRTISPAANGWFDKGGSWQAHSRCGKPLPGFNESFLSKLRCFRSRSSRPAVAAERCFRCRSRRQPVRDETPNHRCLPPAGGASALPFVFLLAGLSQSSVTHFLNTPVGEECTQTLY